MRADAVAWLHLSSLCSSRAQQQLLPGEEVSAAAEGGNFGQGVASSSERGGLGYSSHSVGGLLLRNQAGFELCIFPEE